MTTEAGLAALLLGVDNAVQLYCGSQEDIEAQVRGLSPAQLPFLQRLREALRQCCKAVGVESTFKYLALPVAVGQYLVDTEEGNESEAEMKPQELAAALMPPDSPKDTETLDSEAEKPGVPSDETKQRAVRLYQKGIKVAYVAELFKVEPALIHSWGNWSKRTAAEMERNIQKRQQIQDLLTHGETMKAICQELKLKPKAYHELLGETSGLTLSRTLYDKVMQQMPILKVKNTVSKNTGVSVYIINKWLEGKDIPAADLLTDDEDTTKDVKRTAVEAFYDTGSLASAAAMVKRTPAMVKKWVLDFQSKVDGKSTETEA